MRRPMILAALALSLAAIATTAPGTARAGETSPEEAVRRGNALLEQGKLEGAKAAYEEAARLLPGSAAIPYDLGNVAHDAGDFVEARAHYREALEKLRGTPGLERSILYNLGATAYRRGLELVDADLDQALATLRDGASLFSEVIRKTRALHRRTPEDERLVEDASYNLEVVRLRIKEILDRIKKKAEEEQQPDLVRMVTDLVAAERRVAAAARVATLELAPPQERFSLLEGAASLQRRNLEATARATDLAAKMLEQASGKASPTAPPPPNLEPARKALEACREPQEAARDALDGEQAETSARAAGQAVDALLDALATLDPKGGLAARVETCLEFETQSRQGTRHREESGAAGPASTLQGLETKDRERTLRAGEHLDALAEARPGTQDPGARERAALEGASEELQGAAAAQEQAAARLAAGTLPEAAKSQDEALTHLRKALEEIRELTKTWAELLGDAVKLQERVVFDAESAQRDEQDGADVSKQLGGVEGRQRGAIGVTDRSLEGLREFLAQARAAAAARSAGGGTTGGAGGAGGAPAARIDPVFEEVERLVSAGRVEEEGSASALNRLDVEEALPPARSALKKLQEALEKVRRKQQQQSPPKGKGGGTKPSPSKKDDVSKKNRGSGKNKGDSGNEPPEKKGESKQQPRSGEPRKLTPQEAKRAMAEMLSRQQDIRDRMRKSGRARRVPVDKDW